MSLSRLSLPVRCKAWRGFGRLSGLLVIDGSRFWLEYQKADAMFGFLKSSLSTVHFPLTHLREISLGNGAFWMNPYLELHFNALTSTVQLSSDRPGVLRFRAAFADRKALRTFASALRHVRAVAIHNHIEADLEGEALPPPLIQPESDFATQLGESAKQIIVGVQKFAASLRS